MIFRAWGTMTVEDDDGNIKQIEYSERYYIPSEITWFLKVLGYSKIDIYGAKLGPWGLFSRK